MSREQALRRLSDRYEHRHGLRLSDENDRAYHALLNDVCEPVNVPSVEELNGESRPTAVGLLDDENDRRNVEERVAPYDI